MKSLKTLWKMMADEFAVICRTSVGLCYKKLEARVEHEGDSFLTITLPSFGKDFERCLEAGVVEPSDFCGFSRSRRGPLPLFLGGFLAQVFDVESGVILDEPSVDSVFAIRQLCAVFGKIERPCSDARVNRAIGEYVHVDKEVERVAKCIPMDSRHEFRRMASLLLADSLTVVDQLVYDGELQGKHGPGATADRLAGNGKWAQLEWTTRLESVFPYGDHVLPNWRYHNRLSHVNFLEPDAERPVRVITVPKTLKTPRIIAIEPTCMQYMQQAILRPLIECLEGDLPAYYGGQNRIRGMLGFRDQDPNRDLARLGSQDGELATLDLSQASDRVSTQHVEDLLHCHPHLLEAVMATRSSKAEVPGWGVIPLAKFASMGSALCFPFEAMTFLVCVFLGLQDAASHQFTRRDIAAFRGRVRVYGDDIIVPARSVHHVIGRLEAFGFKVNMSKSFWNGKFRESCGGDYFDGHWVTPVRLRRDLPASRADAREVISLVAFRNQLYTAGLWATCEQLDNMLESILGHFPVVHADSPLLGRLSYLPLDVAGSRLSGDTQTPVVKGWVPYGPAPSSFLQEEWALRKCLDPNRHKPFEDPRHLERQGRPDAVGIKLRWRSPGV